MAKEKKAVAKSRPINILETAYADIGGITDYIANVNLQPLNAVTVADKIFASIDKIASNPFAYKECEYIPTKTKIYRQVKCLSWLIVYKILDSEILILGIIHSASRPAKIRKLKKIK